MRQYRFHITAILLFSLLWSCSDSTEPTTNNNNNNQKDSTQQTVETPKKVNYTINVTSDAPEKSIVTLEQAIGNSANVVEASRVGKDGSFTFAKDLQAYGFYRVNLDNKAYAFVITDQENIKVNFDLANNKVEVLNSPESVLYEKYVNFRKIYSQRAQTLQKNGKRDSVALLQREYIIALQGFVNDNSPSMVALNASKEFASQVDQHKEFYRNIVKIYKDKKYAQDFIPVVEQGLARVVIEEGVIAPDFELRQPNGHLLKLSDLRGQYVLVDFWASWCGPCRRENPNVVKMYQKYHDKGFEILGVSLDKNPNSWKKAIESDNLTWKHVSDLKQWSSQVVPLYGIKGIPMTVLLDKEGKIIATNLRGSSLERKLAEIFK